MGLMPIANLWQSKKPGGKVYWKAKVDQRIVLPQGARLLIQWTGKLEGRTHTLFVTVCNICGQIIGELKNPKDRRNSICQGCIDYPLREED